MARYPWILREITFWILTPFIQLMALHAVPVLGSIYAMTSTPPQPRFLPTPTNVTFLRGELATLRCAVINLGTKYVVWRKASDPNPITVSEEVFVDDETYRVHRVPDSHEWNLQIRNVQCKHNGVYECQVSSKETIIKYVYLLVIDKPPSQPEITITGKLYVDKNLPIRLTCNATGLTHPQDADWFKDGQKISSNKKKKIHISKIMSLETGTISSTLLIEHSKLTDAGTYICRTSESQVTSKKVNVLDADTTNVKRDKEKKASGRALAGTAQSASGQDSFRQAVTFTLVLAFGLSTCQFIVH